MNAAHAVEYFWSNTPDLRNWDAIIDLLTTVSSQILELVVVNTLMICIQKVHGHIIVQAGKVIKNLQSPPLVEDVDRLMQCFLKRLPSLIARYKSNVSITKELMKIPRFFRSTLKDIIQREQFRAILDIFHQEFLTNDEKQIVKEVMLTLSILEKNEHFVVDVRHRIDDCLHRLEKVDEQQVGRLWRLVILTKFNHEDFSSKLYDSIRPLLQSSNDEVLKEITSLLFQGIICQSISNKGESQFSFRNSMVEDLQKIYENCSSLILKSQIHLKTFKLLRVLPSHSLDDHCLSFFSKIIGTSKNKMFHLSLRYQR
eukprot:TRINITY_DN1326_c0_g1_i1.p1 TRINITY_DN1326_c0_g1~~TRINITY_DN1326_c0_g1_i1.p1  ORF type:complete len:313 (-),score=29.46 TRINITY_DN1326_c0_g1_i1:189-1127(-)